MELNIRQALAGRWLFMCLSIFSVTGPAMIYAYGGYQAIGWDAANKAYVGASEGRKDGQAAGY